MSPKKRRKSKTENLIEDLKCPILLRLPPDPVVAPDGAIYDKEAMERHLRTAKRNPDGTVNSPVARTPLNPDAFPLIQMPLIKQHIEKLIDGNMVPSSYVNSWHQDRARLQSLEQAEKGTGDEQYYMGHNYWIGAEGYENDKEVAYMWFMKAHRNESVLGTAAAGSCLLRGEGVRQNIPMGVSMLAFAAHEGSDFAALELGMAHTEHMYEMNDPHMAIFYFKTAADDNCAYPQLSGPSKQHAMLLKLEAEENVHQLK